MKNIVIVPLGIALALMGGGCASVSMPNWNCPGTAAEQRCRAEVYDPYPEAQVGPPVVGARPLEYQIEVPEPVKARMLPLSGRH